VTHCVVCGESLFDPDRFMPTGGRIYCGPKCADAAARARRAPLPETDYTAALRLDVCAYCGERAESICLDHIEPLRFGGANDETNLVAACRSCNASKNDDKLLPFLWWRSANASARAAA